MVKNEHVNRLGICVILFILIALVIAPISSSETTIEPHVDPNKVSGSVDPISIVIVYFNIFERLQGLDFNTTIKYLEEINKTTVPENIRLIMSRLNDLIHSLTILIDKSVVELDNAERYIKEGKITEANESLTRAAIYIFKANDTLIEVKRAWIEFEKSLGKLLPEDYRPRFTEYTAEIELLFKRLNKLLEELKQKQEKLRVEVEQASVKKEYKDKINTTITIYNYSYELKPAGSFYVCGLLTDQYNNTLTYKRLKIYVYVGEEELVAYNVYTDGNGSFCLNTTLPEKYYKHREAPVGDVMFNASIYVMYIPSEDENFSGSSIVLDAEYHYVKTSIRVEGPSTAYPGSNVTFKISVEPLIYGLQRDLIILLDGKIIRNVSIPLTQVSVRVPIPYNTSIGQHFLNFTILGVGEYSPASHRTYIIIKYIPVYVNIQYSQTYVYPIQQGLTISGRVVDYMNNPLKNATIEALGHNTTTNASGFFNLTVQLEKVNMFGGVVEFNVTVKPYESWYPTINKTVRVNYVNLYIIIGTTLYIVLMISVSSKAISFPESFRLSPRRYVKKAEESPVSREVSSEMEGVEEYEHLGRDIMDTIKEARGVSPIMVRETLRQILGRFASYNMRCSSIIFKYIELLRLLEVRFSPMKSGETIKEYIERIADYLPEHVGKKLLLATLLVYKDCFSPKGLSDYERRLLNETIDWVRGNV